LRWILDTSLAADCFGCENSAPFYHTLCKYLASTVVRPVVVSVGSSFCENVRGILACGM
jgi:hypothetical protein